jgi:iron(III) transport system ATP-binding protein
MAEFLGEANLISGSVDKDVASTALGSLPLRSGSTRVARATPAVVMVRPEQVQIRPGPGADGLAARVVESYFHGHDTVVLVKPDPSSGIAALVARTDGALALTPGAEVTVTARGPVLAWPISGRTPIPGDSQSGSVIPAGSVSTLAPAGRAKSLAGGDDE